MTSLDDHGPVLTAVEAAALHDRPEPVAWFVLPASHGKGVIARAHTEAHNSEHLLLGHLAADDLGKLRVILPPGLRRDNVRSTGSSPGCLEWW